MKQRKDSNSGIVIGQVEFSPPFKIKDITLPAAHHTFASGAKRSEVTPAYDQLVPEALELVARRFSAGQLKYGRDNWRKGVGDKEWIRQLYAHMMQHLLHEWAAVPDDMDEGWDGLSNLAAVGWGHQALVWFKIHDRATYDAARKGDI